MSNSSVESLSGLWSHYTWREFAIDSGIAATVAFFVYCVGNNEHANICSKFTHNAVTLAAGFFVPYTIAKYPALQKDNQLKQENLQLFTEIKQELTEIEKKYTIENLKTEQSPKLEQLTKLIAAIKKSAYNCLNIRLSSTEKANNLLSALLEHLQQFSLTLADALEDLDNELLIKEQDFWQQSPQALSKQLVDNEEPRQQSTVTPR